MLSQYTPSTIETKALCSVLRKAELKGTEALVDTMIEICDSQSGILLQDLWEWWKAHKAQDTVKITIPEFQRLISPVYDDPRKTTVTC